MDVVEDDAEDLKGRLEHLRKELGSESLLEGVMERIGDAPAPHRISPWKTFLYAHWGKTSVAATIVLGVAAAVILFDNPSDPAHAIERALAAMDRMERSIRTVHFKAELYKQGDIECWIQFGETSRKPTHMCLFSSSEPVRKIDKPEGSFMYNTRTNRVRRVSRDERTKSWYLDFSQFFKHSLTEARRNPSIQIGREQDPETSRQVIAIRVDEGDRECTYFIDPETELPIRFTSTEPKDLMKYLRPTVAVKNMETIEYNRPIPAGIFYIPAGAEKVTNEHDIIVHPGIGLDVTGMTPERACLKIIDQMLAAANDYDVHRLKKIYWPFMIPPKTMLDGIKEKAGGKKPIEKVEVGTPYQKDGYWYVLCVTRELDGEVKRDTIPIKFYEFDGRTYCLIAWPD